jgi:hypothetical protein
MIEERDQEKDGDQREVELTEVIAEEETKEEKNIPLLPQLRKSKVAQNLYFVNVSELLKLMSQPLREIAENRDFIRQIITKHLSFSLPAFFRLLQTDHKREEKREATEDDITTLMACILYDKWSLFEAFLSIISAQSISPEISAQFYYLAMHFKRYHFLEMLGPKLPPPYTILYVANFYGLRDRMESLFKCLQDLAQKKKAVRLLSQTDVSFDKELHKEIIRHWNSSLFSDESEEKDLIPLPLPVLSMPDGTHSLTQLAKLIGKKEHYLIFFEIKRVAKGQYSKYCGELLKQYVLEKKGDAPDDPQILKVVKLLKGVYGDDVGAYDFVFGDKALQKNVEAQRHFLQLYFQGRFDLLPTQYLASLLIFHKPLNIGALRRLLYFAAKEKEEMPAPSVLDEKTILPGDYIKSIPFLEQLGDVAELALELKLTPDILGDEEFLPAVPKISVIQRLIGEYLYDDEGKPLISRYRVLQPQNIAGFQISHIQGQLRELSLLIGKLEKLALRRKRKLMSIRTISFLCIVTMIVLIIASQFVDLPNAPVIECLLGFLGVPFISDQLQQRCCPSRRGRDCFSLESFFGAIEVPVELFDEINEFLDSVNSPRLVQSPPGRPGLTMGQALDVLGAPREGLEQRLRQWESKEPETKEEPEVKATPSASTAALPDLSITISNNISSNQEEGQNSLTAPLLNNAQS